MSSVVDAVPTKKELRDKLTDALALADGYYMPFVAIRISEAIDALDQDMDDRIAAANHQP